MFESREAMARDVLTLLEALRQQSQGRYACVLDLSGILFEVPAADDESSDQRLRAFLERSRTALLAIPAGMTGHEPMQDTFEDWEADAFLLGFVNGRVAVVVACPDAESARPGAFEVLKVMADRLLRYESRYRLDEKGRGLFMGRARLDVVAVNRPV